MIIFIIFTILRFLFIKVFIWEKNSRCPICEEL